ncbi:MULTISPECIES: hypothetical protein [unclassified Enterococcus]|uniref:hypothetical protein n=1 Tax=unclassified Enterococcus TaxID=2608891 RepID=UPI001A919038|nr:MULTISPECIES: hypothetical protein [unclassified Enterococcus]MBO0462292.1 hypothetical protein [Enterococcus sp. DIV1298c]MBO1301122.1 hypothetical protein [Enterococcus sp. DIV1271a]
MKWNKKERLRNNYENLQETPGSVDFYVETVYYMKLQKLSDEVKAETKYCPFRL